MAAPATPARRSSARAAATLLVGLLALLAPVLGGAATASAARLPGATGLTGGSATTAPVTARPATKAGATAVPRGVRGPTHLVRAAPLHTTRSLPVRGGPSTSGTVALGSPATTYTETACRADRHRLGQHAHSAAAGRAPPASCGS